MKIVAVGYGSPSKMLQAVPTDERPPSIGEVAIDVRAAGINHKDVKLYATEHYARARDRETDFPLDLGLEAAGVVTAVGPQARGPLGPIQVGDAVIACRIQGGYATRIVVAAWSVIPKPERLSWTQAASIMLPGATAFHCLAAVLTRPGDTILVHAAAGTVGRFATQLARVSDAKVIGTASESDFETLQRFGAIPVKYGRGLEDRIRAVAPSGVDAAIDLVGTDEAIDCSLALIEQRQRIATVVNLKRAQQDGFQALGGERGNDEGIMIRDNARYILAALAQSGFLEVQIGRSFPLSAASEAHELMLAGKAGRLVLEP